MIQKEEPKLYAALLNVVREEFDFIFLAMLNSEGLAVKSTVINLDDGRFMDEFEYSHENEKSLMPPDEICCRLIDELVENYACNVTREDGGCNIKFAAFLYDIASMRIGVILEDKKTIKVVQLSADDILTPQINPFEEPKGFGLIPNSTEDVS